MPILHFCIALIIMIMWFSMVIFRNHYIKHSDRQLRTGHLVKFTFIYKLFLLAITALPIGFSIELFDDNKIVNLTSLIIIGLWIISYSFFCVCDFVYFEIVDHRIYKSKNKISKAIANGDLNKYEKSIKTGEIISSIVIIVYFIYSIIL